MSTLWRLLAIGPAAPMKAADAVLNAWEDGPALSWSFFEDGSETVWRLDVLFAQQIEVDRFLGEIGLTGADIDVQFAPLPEEDWVRLSLAGLPAVKAGRFVIYGEHARGELAPGEIGIEIEAGPAFGTGHHGTTRGCLIACDRIFASQNQEVKTVLDLGCGTGALAIAAALLWPDARILASDIDPEAVAETDINTAKNGVSSRIEAITADGFTHPAFEGAIFDLVFANILAGPLQELARALAQRLAPRGRAILSGLLEEQIAAVEAAYTEAGLFTEHTDIIEGWAILTLKAR
ncbi:MAG: 50S ribosomal protein L11 methyltransferase [Caulobacterales bacterium]|uniref:50S ribosomal protein L11 methyltransferase n=1 Tax=Glycocaulis sp. TaxID=1969725 RepID=UPI003F9FFA87